MLTEIPLNDLDFTNKGFKIEEQITEILSKKLSSQALRWGGIAHKKPENSLLIEAIACPFLLNKLGKIENKYSEKKVGAHIIPTGIGCSIGGYGGDANLITSLLIDEFDYLIVNPNVTNGGAWQNLSDKILYVEGSAIDLFMQSKIALRPKKCNKIGVVFDKNLPEEILWKELQTIKAAETIWGIDFVGYKITKEAIKPKINVVEGGNSSGSIGNHETLLDAAKKLIEHGAEAIAVVTYWNEELNELDQNYVDGNGPDPIGGIEAVISHLVTKKFLIPCAHAPTFPFDIDKDNYCKEVDSRVSPEIASYSFLPSVLKGLSKTPKLITKENTQIGDMTVHDLDAFIGPKDCWAGSSFLSALSIPNLDCFAVQSNESKTGIEADLFGDCFSKEMFKPNNYLELIGLLKAKSKGMKLQRF